jgi:hypothetical protein
MKENEVCGVHFQSQAGFSIPDKPAIARPGNQPHLAFFRGKFAGILKGMNGMHFFLSPTSRQRNLNCIICSGNAVETSD